MKRLKETHLMDFFCVLNSGVCVLFCVGSVRRFVQVSRAFHFFCDAVDPVGRDTVTHQHVADPGDTALCNEARHQCLGRQSRFEVVASAVARCRQIVRQKRTHRQQTQRQIRLKREKEQQTAVIIGYYHKQTGKKERKNTNNKHQYMSITTTIRYT